MVEFYLSIDLEVKSVKLSVLKAAGRQMDIEVQQILRALEADVLLPDTDSFHSIINTTGCFLRPDIKRFCLTFTIGPDRIWFCLITV